MTWPIYYTICQVRVNGSGLSALITTCSARVNGIIASGADGQQSWVPYGRNPPKPDDKILKPVIRRRETDYYIIPNASEQIGQQELLEGQATVLSKNKTREIVS